MEEVLAALESDVAPVVYQGEQSIGGFSSEPLPGPRLDLRDQRALRLSLSAARVREDFGEGVVTTTGRDGVLVKDVTDSPSGPQTVRMAGVLDLSTASSALRQLLSVLDRGEGLLVVDLDGVSSMNSSGLLVLESASRNALERRRLISFINARSFVRRVGAPCGSRHAIVDGEVVDS